MNAETQRMFEAAAEDKSSADSSSASIIGIEAAAEAWVSSYRKLFSAVLGRKLGESDVASFKWTQNGPGRRHEGPAAQSRAAAWRSVGNGTHQLATAIRNHRTAAAAAAVATATADLTASPSLATRFWNLHRLTDRQLGATGEGGADDEQPEWINTLVNLYNNAASAEAIAPDDMSRLAARAMKSAHLLDDVAAKERRAAFLEWLDGGATHSRLGRNKLPGRAASRFIRGPSGWSPTVRHNTNYNKAQKQFSDDPDEKPVRDEDGDIDAPHGLLNRQGDIELEADKWAKLWRENGEKFCPPPGRMQSELLPITAEQIRSAALSFPADGAS